MITRSAFHLDCNPVIPECRFKCAKCLGEIRAVLGKISAVNNVSIEGQGDDAKLVINYDSSSVSVEDLLETLRGLPSFYKGFFVPKLLETKK